MEKLKQQVLDGLKAGKSVDELAASVTMEEYKDWQQYAAWRELNVRGMARFLKEVPIPGFPNSGSVDTWIADWARLI